MHIIALGLNHATAPVEVRERVFVCESDTPRLMAVLKNAGVERVVVLSTCNRTEIYCWWEMDEEPARVIGDVLTGYFSLSPESLRKYMYLFRDEEACGHLFLVAAGLDSMVLGEAQILGQVKDAYRLATQLGATGPYLDKVFHRAFHVAKRVRTETKIGYNPVSISSMAVELSKKIFGDLTKKGILVIGAGEMCEIALKHFKKEGLREVFIANRTYQNAQKLADEFMGAPSLLEDLPELLPKVDMVLSSTGSERPIITTRLVASVMKKRKSKPLFFIDIAVPRDVEEGVNDMENVYLYDIDDLKELSQRHLSDRVRESERARAIVEEEVKKFSRWLDERDMRPLIAHIVDRTEEMRRKETRKTLQRLRNIDENTEKSIEILTKAIVNKIVHQHIAAIKENGSPETLEIIRKIFKVSGTEDMEGDEDNLESGDTGQ
jgi:glutamyl-tRNA reductase